MLQDEMYKLFHQHFPFWIHLNDAEKQFLYENTFTAHYPKGSSIYGGSSDCLGILLVRKGQLRTYLLSDEGREVTLYRLFPGDICVLSASCVLETITFDIFIDAEEDTDLLIINSSVFRQLSQNNIYVKCFGYEQATYRFSDVMWAMEQILFMGADKRLAIFLQDEIVNTGENTIKMTHEQIARYMGSAREVVSRMLKYFESEGIVKLARGEIQIINKEKLNSML